MYCRCGYAQRDKSDSLSHLVGCSEVWQKEDPHTDIPQYQNQSSVSVDQETGTSMWHCYGTYDFRLLQ